MKLGVFTALLADKPLNAALDYLQTVGIEAVEIGCGGYPGNSHANPVELLKDDKKIVAFKNAVAQHGMIISALSVHGNPVHPKKDMAEQFNKDYENTVLLAEKLGIDTVVTFSGCPGGSPADQTPNWVTCPWPGDFLEVLDYQWNEILIPYWKKAVAFANAHKVTKIALEMHPGFCVYNPYTLLKLRAAVGNTIGSNFDPSHLLWQGMNPVAAIRELKDCIFHFHAKDAKIDKINTEKNGVLDTRHYSDELNRSWVFRACGYGNDATMWKDIMSNLRMIGYDHVVSIEHEDSLMSVNEGLTKAVDFLRGVLIKDKAGEMWWA